ncbi:ephrin type-A receptor 1 isoform X2 [Ambystoma mexicanum]|uniref:ephrin type-A receptor 1 isoform X2 n=1 Tax=Ambystoma mexicanum TaxID=8296 RepID=UPI0037E8D16D
MENNPRHRLGYAFRLLLFHVALQAAGTDGKEVNLLDTATAQAGLGWLPDPPENGWSEIQQMLNGTPTYTYQDCSVMAGDTDHWLRSNWIYRDEAVRIFVEQKFTVRDCKSFSDQLVACKETFNLYYMESDQDQGILFRRPLFTKVNTIAADQSFSSKDIGTGTLQLNVEVSSVSPLTRKGFYLAFQNFGACVALVAVRVFYKVCPKTKSHLAHFPDTIAGAERLVVVEGTCIENAQEESSGPPKMHCSTDGEWLVPVGQCQCQLGFEALESGGECLACQQGFYRASQETPHCLNCPPNSSSGSPGATACTCNAGFYRTPSEDHSVSCTRPPSTPRNVSSSIQGTAVSLRWFPPSDLGGRQDLTYQVSCEKCPLEAGVCEPCEEGLSFVPGVDGFSEPAVTVEGLEPYCNYTFTVEAKNAVSGLGRPNRGSATVHVSVGHAAPVTVSPLRLVERGVHSLSVSWTGPRQRSPSPLQYEVTIYPKGEEDHFSVKRLQESDLTLTDLQPDTVYLIQVQTLTPLGPGPLSFPQEFRTLPPDPSGLSAGAAAAIAIGVLLAVGALVLLLYIRRKRSRRRRGRPDTSSSGSDREKGLLKPYVDLQAYQDPSQAFHQFTKEIDPAYITTENVIGEGEFGEVFRGSLRYPGKERVTVAIKTLKTTYSDSQWWNFLREATIMGQFGHQNIVRLEGVVTKQKPMMIVTEYMENGALDAFLKENEDKFSCTQLVGMLQGIAAGMRYLSDRNYVHRDLAARNVLVTRSLLCKVSDFGLSRILENDIEGTYETRGGKIPIRWTAPEAIAQRIFTSASDVWSFGIVMWEVLCYGDKPYGDMSNQEVMKSIEDGYRLPPPVDAPSILYDLMKRCWAHERSKRPKFREIQTELDHLVANPHCLRNIADFDPRVTLRLPSCSGSDGIPYRTISEWLESIRMKRYIINFRTAGLDTMESVLDLTTEDLKQMGISLPGHQKRILCSIQGFQE